MDRYSSNPQLDKIARAIMAATQAFGALCPIILAAAAAAKHLGGL